MREVKPTQKPVPSSDIKDLFFNSGLLDIWATSLEHKYIDRFGNCHLTSAGMEWIFKELVDKFKVDMNTAIIAAGYITIDSFQQGAQLPDNKLTQRNQVLRDEATGEYYRWDGDLPKQVPIGSTPESTGGVDKGAWVSVGGASLREDLKSNSGAGMVGAESGKTVQDSLNDLNDDSYRLNNTPSSFPPDFTRKTIYKTLPLFSQNWQEIKDRWDYSYVYAQGLVFDDVTDEMLIMYSAVYDSGSGQNTNLKIFIDIYDANRNYVQTVCAGFGFPEGAVIGYVNGERRILLASNGSNEKLAVHSLPLTSTLTKFQELPKLFDSVQKFSTQMSACGKYTLLLDPALSTARRGPVHSAYSLHLTNELLTDGNASSLRKSVIYLPAYCTNLGDPSITPKLQSVCLTPNGIIGIGGSQWYVSQYGKDADNSLNLQYSTYTSNGSLMSNTVIGYDQLKDIFSEYDLPVSFFEPESICYYRGAYYSLLAHANTLADPVNYPNGALTIFIDGIENESIGKTMHLDKSATKGAFSSGYSTKSCIPYPMNSRTGKLIESANEAIKYMIDNMIDEFKSTIGIFGQAFKVETSYGDVIYTNGGDVEITTANWLWFNLEIKNVNSGTAIGASSVKYRISASGNDQSSWKWSALPIIVGGTNSIITIPEGMGDNVKQVSASGSVSTRYVTRNGVVAENYYSIAAGGVVGGITINANSTTFSTTSDVTWKNEHGVNEYLPDIISEAVASGAAQYAAFKANPESIYPMCMAQKLFKFFPEAVHVGDSSPENPWMVDASKLVPSLMIAIAQLSEKIKHLESK